MTARQVWTIFCDGVNDTATGELPPGVADVACGWWIGKEETVDAARQLARQYGWGKTGPDTWLCPRHRREAGRDRAGLKFHTGGVYSLVDG